MVKINIFDNPFYKGTEFADLLGGYDSNLWLDLFIKADKINPNLAQSLMYLRNTGCRLHERKEFNFRIMPIEDYWDQAGVNYEEEKKCLNPYREDIIKLLKGLRL